MKIMKIFGVVVGIHVFFLIGVFVIPGCSSTSKPAPSPDETITSSETPPPTITVPPPAPETDAPASSAITFGPDLNYPAAASTGGSGGSRYSPTRPGTPAASVLAAEPAPAVTQVQTYTVKPNDNLWTIARKNHLTTAELARANNLRADATLQIGQRLVIPVKAAPAAGSVATTKAPTAKTEMATAARSGGNVVKYTVKPGESLSVIAQQFGVTVKELGTANNIADPRKLQAGTELIIPGGGWKAPGGASKAATTTPAAEAPPPAPALPPQIDLNAPAAPAPNDVPVIKLDEAPLAPAPKGN
jgi:LysM repeat protein